MHIQKLQWAGIIVKSGDYSIVIDPLYHVNTGFFGEPLEKFYPLNEFERPNAVFVTHAHSDHFDYRAIGEFYGESIPVYLPIEALENAKKTNLTNVMGVNVKDTIEIGDLKVTATYSVDGLGDPQVAWVVSTADKKIIHCGDTLWHGYWWNISNEYGPFDVAFLPINAPVINDSDLIPSHQPICMNAEQAVSAAVVLRATTLIPIHFGAFHFPPNYISSEDSLPRLLDAASKNNVKTKLLNTKEWYQV
ncbi:MBL fold metallo-hydrolase [Ammoniphilus sp. CFH 90114]|uniref:MBL fold metallo-hydrolase n=1 Tax=Ammoniphilus sp. CFH 90114 TaxID=2493665 RepID=UPI00100FAF3A|nr:MBL fold metallo-hydrolase [Ammoniphilus sp. CFH 90114]RXT04555.1 MBL fold metallo-hydrolase [Ammoniphilus sp. CFH 90114]